MFEHLPEFLGLSFEEYTMDTKYVFLYLGNFSEYELHGKLKLTRKKTSPPVK